jgi:hypothetical protein
VSSAAAEKLMPVLDRMAERIDVSEGAIDTFIGTLEVLLEMIESFGVAFGVIKNPMENKEYRRRQEQKRIKDAERELAGLPSEEKAAALEAAGDTAGAEAMRQQLKDPNAKLREGKIRNALAIAQAGLGMTESIEDKLAKATALGSDAQSAQQFQQIYAGLGANPEAAESQMRANILSHALAANPANDTYSTKDFIPGENADQRAARLGFAQGQAERKAGAGGGQNTETESAATGLAAALKSITESAAPAAAALKKISDANQASIAPGM